MFFVYNTAMKNDVYLDDLQWGGLKILQSKKYFRFGTDSVLLADFFKPAGENSVCDLGCGTGILSILIGGKNRNITVYAVEIQKTLADMASCSCKLNNLKNVNVYLGDIKDCYKFLPRCSAVVCNPPYEKLNTGKMPESESCRIARYEVKIDFAGITQAASRLLGDGGRFYFVHKTSRLDEITSTLSEFGFYIKTIRFIHPSVDKEATLMLICARKNAGQGMRVMPPLLIYDGNGKYTEELERIYHPYKGE